MSLPICCFRDNPPLLLFRCFHCVFAVLLLLSVSLVFSPTFCHSKCHTLPVVVMVSLKYQSAGFVILVSLTLSCISFPISFWSLIVLSVLLVYIQQFLFCLSLSHTSCLVALSPSFAPACTLLYVHISVCPCPLCLLILLSLMSLSLPFSAMSPFTQ